MRARQFQLRPLFSHQSFCPFLRWSVLQTVSLLLSIPPLVRFTDSVPPFVQSSVGQIYRQCPSFCPFLRWSVLHSISIPPLVSFTDSVPPFVHSSFGQFYRQCPSFCPFLRWSVSLTYSPHSFHSSSWPVFQTCAVLVQADRNESSRTRGQTKHRQPITARDT